MHGRAAMREEAGRLEQRQPGAQSGGEVVRSGRDRGLEPGDGVLGAGQRNEQRLVAGGGAARCLTGRRIRVLPGLAGAKGRPRPSRASRGGSRRLGGRS